MNRRGLSRWIPASGAIAILMLAAVWLMLRGRSPQLPPGESFSGQPAAFNRALQRARAEVRQRPADLEALRSLARLYQANRLFPQARACYEIIAHRPAGLDARDHDYLAAIDQEEGDLAGMAAELRAVLESEPGHVPARLALADALFKSGDAAAAGEQYRLVLQADAANPAAAVGLARVDLQRGADDAALTRLRDVVNHHPESASAAALLAQLLSRRGESEAAAALTEASQQVHDPVVTDPWLGPLLADCYDLQRLSLSFEQYRLANQMNEALTLLDRLEELDPNGWISPLMRGWSEKKSGHFAEAEGLFRRSLDRGGDPEKICPLLSATLLEDGRLAEAAGLLASSHAKWPESVPILRSYCEVLVKQQNSALARPLLVELLQKEPYQYQANLSLVRILWQAGEKEAGAQRLVRLVAAYPHDVDSRGLLAQYYLEQGEPGPAIAPLEQAVAQPDAPPASHARLVAMLDTAYLAAGSIAASAGNLKEAVKFSERAIHLLPDDPKGYSLKVNAEVGQQEFAAAEQTLTVMQARWPEDPAIFLSLGDVREKQGDADGARRHWQKALELLPSDATAGQRNLVRARLARLAPVAGG